MTSPKTGMKLDRRKRTPRRGGRIAAIGLLALVAGAGLAACTAGPQGGAPSGSPEDLAALRDPCSAAARRIAAPVAILGGRFQGGKPVLLLTAGDMRYICRQEADGSVAIFSELAF